MTIKILLLEDDSRRIEIFRSTLGHHDLVVTTNAQDAIAALKENTFDLIFLDHDLGGETFVNTNNKNTGSEVVRWMCENMVNPCQIIIHSMNTPAAYSMKYTLEKAGMASERVSFMHLVKLLQDPGFINE